MLSELKSLKLGSFKHFGADSYYNILTIPNFVTLSGFFALLAYGYAIVAESILLEWICLFWCFFSDFLDGLAARVFNQHSWLGVRLDPLRDRLLFFVLIVRILAIKGRDALFWQLGAIIFLELLIMACAIYYSKPHISIKPGILGRIRHFISIILLCLVVADLCYGEILAQSTFQAYYLPVASICSRLDICFNIILSILLATAAHYWLIARKYYH